MSVAKKQLQESREKKGSRGSTDNKGRLAAFARNTQTSGADWGACSPDKLQGVIVAITGLGGAVTFGMARDGGAHMVTLLLNKERQTLWLNGNADLDAELDDIIGVLEAED